MESVSISYHQSSAVYQQVFLHIFLKQMLDLMILKSSVPSHANIWDCNNKKEYLHWMDTILDISENILFLKTEIIFIIILFHAH